MRTIASLLAPIILFAACGSGQSGAEAARKEAEAEEAKIRAQDSQRKTERIRPPVGAGVHVPCEQLIDVAAFTTALGEKEPLTLKDLTANAAESAASCSLVRGGKVMSAAEQAALLKKQRRLGVMAGDDVCNITAYCSTIEDEAHFKERCKQLKLRDDESLGFYACLQVVAQGADDVNTFKILDEDTKCILQVRGGPSMIDNEVIATCAKAARELIGPNNIKTGGAPAGAGSAGSGSGSAGSGSGSN
ncbi:MAG: hypothetical protein K8W52_36175 [Deltaproteobacteria bacterium]|nr:hypothetical protein [Deltaproteobacteria bacterium]